MAIVQGFIGGVRPFPSAGFAFLGATPSSPVLLNLLSASQIDDLHVRLTFDSPPAGDVLDPDAYTITNPGAGVAASPVSVAFDTPPPGGVFPVAVIVTLSNELTSGRAYAVLVSDLEGPTGEVLGEDAATWLAVATGPAIVSASGAGRTVIVNLSEPIDPTTLGTAGDWAVEPLATGGMVTVADLVLDADNLVVSLTLDPALTTVEGYRVTAPATVADPAGNAIAVRTADFLAPREAEPENGRLWAATEDGAAVDLGEGAFELMPWGPDVPTADLPSLVWVSLFSNRRADPDDQLPDTAGDPVYRGGVWFDSFSGEKYGSRLWLLARSAITPTNLLLAKGYALEALQWMIDDGLVARWDVDVLRQANDRVLLKIEGYYADGTKVSLAHSNLWDLLAAA